MSATGRKEQKITFLGKPVRLISADSVPGERTQMGSEMVESLNSIPVGSAISGTREELGRSYSSIKVAIQRFKKRHLIPDEIYSASRKINGKEVIFIVHKAKEQKE